jgi:hypothetical protein
MGIVLLAASGADIASRKVKALRLRFAGGLAAASLGLAFAVHAGQGITAFYLTTPSNPASSQWNLPITPSIQKAKELQGQHRIIEVKAASQEGKWFRPMLTGRLSSLYGLAGAGGYESLTPTWVLRLWHSVELGRTFPENEAFSGGFYTNFFDDRINLNLLRRLSVGLIMATPEAKLRSPDNVDLVAAGQIREVYRGPDGMLFVIPDALPRAYLVQQAEIANTASALEGMMKGTVDPTRRILLTGKEQEDEPVPPADGAAPEPTGTAQIVSEDLTRLTIRVVAHRPAYLQVNDSWAPGWKATLDGKHAAVLRSDYAFRAVFVPEGDHLVEMVYRPWGELVPGFRVE